MSVFSTIVCSINLSESPDDICQYVNDIVARYEARLILVNITPKAESVLRHCSNKEMLAHLLEENRKANKEAFAEYVRTHFDSSPELVFAEGRIEEELIKVIDKYCADLVIIGSSSTRGFLGGFFNKTSENIIGKTRVPVMVIPNELSLECSPDF
ncbi:MAG: universal stress protein [Mailhella sp.]|nr:universal stress protein [Mailhella sp.]MBQ3171081.1 universal stress protein [Mailhella sp.]